LKKAQETDLKAHEPDQIDQIERLKTKLQGLQNVGSAAQ